MLKTLRENVAVKRVVLWLVVGGMVLGLGIGVTAVYENIVTGKTGGSSSGPWAVKVGDEAISPLMVQNEIRSLAREYRSRGASEIPDFEKRVQFEAVSRLVRRTLELQEARKAGLAVTDQEVSDAVTSLPQFQRDGRWIGEDAYKEVLRRNEFDVRAFEMSIREGLLTDKWESLVASGAVVTDREVDDEYRRRNEKVRIDYVSVDPDKYAPSSTPSETEIKTYYDAHPEKYQRTEGRQAHYVLFDSKAVEAQVPEPTPEEMQAAFDSDPSKYPSGFDASRDDIKKQLKYQRAQAEASRRAAEFAEGASGGSEFFDAAASKAALKVEDSGIIRRDPDATAKLGADFLDALFRAPQNAVQGPVRMLQGSAAFIVTAIQPPHRASTQEARTELVTDVNKQRGRDAALSAAKSAASGAGGDLGAVARAVKSEVKNGKIFGRSESIPDIGFEPSLETAAFASEPGRIGEPVSLSTGATVVFKVMEKKAADTAIAPDEREKIRADLRRSREYLLVNSVLEAAMKKAAVQVNPEFSKQFGT